MSVACIILTKFLIQTQHPAFSTQHYLYGMLTRLVRMTFRPEELDAFLEIWQHNRQSISGFPGCQSVQLLQDATDTNVFYTLSYWNGFDDLEAYRHSPLFARVWKATRALFADKALTYSMLPPPPDPGKIA